MYNSNSIPTLKTNEYLIMKLDILGLKSTTSVILSKSNQIHLTIISNGNGPTCGSYSHIT